MYFVWIRHDCTILDAAEATRINKQNQGGVFLKQIQSLAQQEMLYLFLPTNMQFFSRDTWEGSN